MPQVPFAFPPSFPFAVQVPFTGPSGRIRPEADDVSRSIIAPAPGMFAPHVAPDMPETIDPGPDLGVRPDACTREDLLALHHAPHHVVLVLTRRRADLYLSDGDRLALVKKGAGFPLTLAVSGEPRRRGARRPATLAEVDQALGAYLAGHPAVVVVAGPQTLVTAFHEASGAVESLAGTVYGGFDVVDVVELARRVRPVLRRYVEFREQAALSRLAECADAGRVASGLDAVWDGARAEQPELLVLEESLPEEFPDLDELIRVVLERGGGITLAPEGSLAEHGRVALALA